MSKPFVRILFAVLLSIVIIAAIATTVQARLGSGSVNTHVAAVQHISGRTSINARSSMYQPLENLDPGSGHHDCGSPSSSADD
jgi:hypothetical protein